MHNDFIYKHVEKHGKIYKTKIAPFYAYENVLKLA